MKFQNFVVEFKVGETWIKTELFSGTDAEETARQTESALHCVGMKARVVIETTTREFL